MKGLGARSPFVLLAALAAVLGIMAPRAVFEGRRMVSRWLRRVLLVVATVSAVATTPFVMGASPAAADSAPSISSVEPPTGASGTWVTITGSGFQNVGTVYFGNELAEAFRTISPTQVYAEAPPTQISSGDYVDIQVYSNAVSSAITTADQFTYRAASLNQEVASAPILHTIFWLPSSGHLQDGTSYSVSPTFIDNVNRLVSDFTLPNNSYWGILRQYGVGYPTYGGALVQPDDFPSRLGSSECFTGGNCITDADIRDLIGSAVKATPGWGQTINDIYIVVLAPGERAGAADGGCGYNLGGGIGIGDESWAVIQPCASAPGPYDEPSNSVQNSLAHEVAEAVTDPDASNLPFSRGLGWEFPDGGNNNQIGDACEGYKPQTGLFDLGEATVQFPDGDYFLLPALWSNAQTNPVVDGFAAGSSGCVWSDAPAPTIDIHADSQPGVTSQSSPPTLVAGQGFTVTATGLTPGSTATVNVGIDPGVSPTNRASTVQSESDRLRDGRPGTRNRELRRDDPAKLGWPAGAALDQRLGRELLFIERPRRRTRRRGVIATGGRYGELHGGGVPCLERLPCRRSDQDRARQRAGDRYCPGRHGGRSADHFWHGRTRRDLLWRHSVRRNRPRL